MAVDDVDVVVVLGLVVGREGGGGVGVAKFFHVGFKIQLLNIILLF